MRNFGGVGADIIGQMLVGMMGGDDDDDEADALQAIVSGSGDDYMVGADIIGALLQGKAPKKPAMNVNAIVKAAQQQKLMQKARTALLARAINPNAVEYRESSYNRSGELWLPIPPTIVAAGATATIPVGPQVPIQVLKVFVPSTTGVNFGLVDARVGKDSQFIAAGEVPCEIFSEVSVDSNVRWDTCAVGQSIILTVRNRDAVNPQTFNGLMKGNVVLR
jgi:hypothetical protein